MTCRPHWAHRAQAYGHPEVSYPWFLHIVAWRVAGYLGADYFVRPALGTPWAPGRLFRRRQESPDPAPVLAG
jgi:hypothetical protein